MSISSINPATGELVEHFDELGQEEIENKLRLAIETFKTYRKTSFEQRAEMLLRAADILEQRKSYWARTITVEMGKTLKAAIAEVEKCASGCRYYAENTARFLADEPIQTEAIRSYVRFLPIGPVLAIMPWNFPFWQVFRFAAPALMAGNVALLKHASNVPRSALNIEKIFLEAGFPPGVFQTLLISSKMVKQIVTDDRVAAVTLTGSESAGASVGEAAGASIKKAVMELGGSDPFIVMPSGDVEMAARVGVAARNINNGQSCIAAKRFIVHEQVYREFEEFFVEKLRKLSVGDPLLPGTDIGPLATGDIRAEIEMQVDVSVKSGARVLIGGKRLEGAGNFYRPTALADIPKNCPVYSQEVFGPVALLFKVKDIGEAIALANDSSFGLGSSVWTNDPAEAERFIQELESGQTFVNSMVVSDPRLPFGGVKRSGHGRELGVFGIREFVNAKTVHVGKTERFTRQDTE
jgi:succinate-semialdehyde dehydrogenase / glutarate-semialdehyde dehydrogenase